MSKVQLFVVATLLSVLASAAYADPGMEVTVRSRVLSARSGPSAQTRRSGFFRKGDVLRVVEQNGQWTKVSDGTRTAYVLSRHISHPRPASQPTEPVTANIGQPGGNPSPAQTPEVKPTSLTPREDLIGGLKAIEETLLKAMRHNQLDRAMIQQIAESAKKGYQANAAKLKPVRQELKSVGLLGALQGATNAVAEGIEGLNTAAQDQLDTAQRNWEQHRPEASGQAREFADALFLDQASQFLKPDQLKALKAKHDIDPPTVEQLVNRIASRLADAKPTRNTSPIDAELGVTNAIGESRDPNDPE